eukprot:jgi/Chlat1/965/Chrsp108S01391
MHGSTITESWIVTTQTAAVNASLLRSSGMASTATAATALLLSACPTTSSFRQPFRRQLSSSQLYRTHTTKLTRRSSSQHGKLSSSRVVMQAVAPLQQQLAEEQPATSDSMEKFSWTKQWYPAGIVMDLDPSKPNAVTILGEPIVLWRDKEGVWRAFKDRCPHRLARLSEGRIDANGHLQCGYHGWEFEGDGSCAKIPQLAQPSSTVLSSPRACATSLPTKEELGLLWLWPDASSKQQAESTPLPLPRAIREGAAKVNYLYMREIYYGFDYLLDNVLDISHLPFAHHGVIGMQRAMATPIELNVVENEVNGFLGVAKQGPFSSSQRFEAPCLWEFRFGPPGKYAPAVLALYAVPMSPGRTRLISLDTRPNNPSWAKSKPEWTPRWLDHMVRTSLLNGDDYIIAKQERDAAPLKDKYWSDCFVPAQSDRLSARLWQWLSTAGSWSLAGVSVAAVAASVALYKFEQHFIFVDINYRE